MRSDFMIYGSTGFVGSAIARRAVQQGLRPVLGGRNAAKVEAQAAQLALKCSVFSLDDPAAVDQALGNVAVVLHCAGPYSHTSKQMVDGCLRSGTHYLDITGEIPVYEAVAAHDAEAKARGCMLLPGVGFDVVPTDCLARHLKHRVPSATHLTLAWQSVGPAAIPPGTANTALEMVPYGTIVRINGQLKPAPRGIHRRTIDFGHGPTQSTLFTWGDVFTAFYSTGIPNIEVFAALPDELRRQLAAVAYIRALFKWAAVRRFFRRGMRAGSTADEQAGTHTHVWGEVEDAQGHKAASRLHGPEAGVIWTSLAALAVVRRLLAGETKAGFQTPALAFGADFVLECEGVSREDVTE